MNEDIISTTEMYENGREATVVVNLANVVRIAYVEPLPGKPAALLLDGIGQRPLLDFKGTMAEDLWRQIRERYQLK